MTKRRGLSEVQKVAKGGSGKAVLDGLKEGGEWKRLRVEWRGAVIRGVMVALNPIHVSSATAATYRKPIIKPFFHSLPLHEHLFSDYVKKKTGKSFWKKKTFSLSLYTLLQYYRYAVNRLVDRGVCGCLNNVQGKWKRVVASGMRQSSLVRDDHPTLYLFFF